MAHRLLVCIICVVLPGFAMQVGFGVTGNAGMGFSRWETAIVDAQGQPITDHLSSRQPVYGFGPTMNFWFNKTYGLNIGVQYSWYKYNYTYDYTTSSEAIEWRWNYKNLLFPVDLKIGIPLGQHRVFVGGGVLLFKQLSGEMNAVFWGQSTETENIPDENLETGILPRGLAGAEFHLGNIGFQTLINYHYGLHGVDNRFAGSPISTHHLTTSLGVLYYFGKITASDNNNWW